MSTFWKIEEPVGGGHYITWDGIYETKESAWLAVARTGSAQARPVLYETRRGHGTGPVRVE